MLSWIKWVLITAYLHAFLIGSGTINDGVFGFLRFTRINAGSGRIHKSGSRVGFGKVVCFGRVIESRFEIRYGTIFHNFMSNIGDLVVLERV